MIQSFDVHVYYTSESRERAVRLRDAAGEKFKDVRVSRLVDKKVGPHPLPMFQIQFRPELLAEMILWLMANRNGLSVLVHQVTGNDLKDHYEGAMWMGQMLQLDDSQLTVS